MSNLISQINGNEDIRDLIDSRSGDTWEKDEVIEVIENKLGETVDQEDELGVEMLVDFFNQPTNFIALGYSTKSDFESAKGHYLVGCHLFEHDVWELLDLNAEFDKHYAIKVRSNCGEHSCTMNREDSLVVAFYALKEIGFEVSLEPNHIALAGEYSESDELPDELANVIKANNLGTLLIDSTLHITDETLIR